jgi:flavin reductase (DIM6/NTAB) family NADH-FMN oxidoreductase RutF
MAAIGSEEFRRACGRFATGVSVAGVTDSEGSPHGLTVSSIASVSLDPPLILICIAHAAASIEFFRAARYFGLSMLADTQRDLSERFARKGHDRFDGLAWHAGVTGVPLLEGALAHLECAVYRRVTAGDHDIFIGEAVGAHVQGGDPLVHYASRYRHLAT